ncbi:MAG: methyltransferase [Candidatus Promineifilaceae bacterium]|nr:methyltransferase [Candidatus Promineifilaceae bacterium]
MDKTEEELVSIRKQAKRMIELIYGNWQTCVTYTFAELNIAGLLILSPQSAAALAAKTDTNKHALARFLRCAATLGFIQWDSRADTYALTSLGELLHEDHPQSLRAAARLNGAAYRYQPWGHLVEILKRGSSAGIAPTFGRGTLDYLADKPTELDVFHQAMTDLSALEDQAIINAYDFSPFKQMIDIGSGHGEFIKAVLREFVQLHGTMFDLPQTFAVINLPGADEFDGRLTQQTGDFFVTIPTHGDLYVMKNVIHNWPKRKVLRLLKNVSEAMSSAATPTPKTKKRLLIIEHLITEEDHTAKWLDLNFMILVDGRERTLDEYRSLAGQAGFAICQVITTHVGRSIIEFSLANLQ